MFAVGDAGDIGSKPVRDALAAGILRDDTAVAAALAHGIAVVTRNVADFKPTGVPLVDPWEPLQGTPVL